MRKPQYTRKKQKNPYLILLFIIIIPVAYYFIFHMNKDEITIEDASEYLVGSWQRMDGNYRIEITAVGDEGLLDAGYFNPGPINVGKSGWRVHEKVLQVFIQMDDVNYPGSFYDLKYNKEKNILHGTYYQAVAKETYNISFKRKQ